MRSRSPYAPHSSGGERRKAAASSWRRVCEVIRDLSHGETSAGRRGWGRCRAGRSLVRSLRAAPEDVMGEGPSELGEHIHAEAEEYRGGAARPLGGYVLVMAVFAALVAGAAGVAVATGRRLPAKIRTLDLILLTAGTHKLSRILSKDSATSPLRAPFTRYSDTGGPAEVQEEVRRSSQIRHVIGELITCPFCLDMWIATGFAIGTVFAPKVTRLVAMTFTVSAGADFLQLAYAALQRTS